MWFRILGEIRDIERIAAGMAQKVWQKITLLDATLRTQPSQSAA